jgi:ELWxxDGT repeat protein
LVDALHYSASSDGRTGRELWKVDAGGSVVQAADIAQGIDESYPEGFTIFDPSGVLLS